MKKLITLLFVTGSLYSFGQTNALPTTGNIGIGTTSPASKLQLVGGTAALGSTYMNVLNVPINESPAYFYVDTKLPFSDNVAPQIQLTGYNYGNANKAIKLTLSWYVYANAFYWAQYKNDLGYYNPSSIKLGTYDDGGTTRIRIQIANDGTYWSGYFFSATDKGGTAANYEGWTYNFGEMPSGTGNILTVPEHAGIVYGNTGNVGIGIANPQANLHIKGGSLNWNETTQGLTEGTIHLSPNAIANHGNAITFGDRDNGGNIAQAGIYVRTDGTYGSKMYFSTSNDYGVGSQTRMMINNLGNVGIGTTSPNALLEVNGATFINTNAQLSGIADAKLTVVQNAATADWTTAVKGGTTSGSSYGSVILAGTNSSDHSFLVRNVTNTTSYFNVRGDGNVGMGTSSPDNVFLATIEGTSGGSAAGLMLQGDGETTGAYFGQATSTSPNDFEIWNERNGFLRFASNNVERLRITSNGYVGIGTPTPSTALTVNGTVTAKKVKVTQTGWPDYVFAKGYALKPLSEVEAYIIKFQHLPEVPNAEEVAKNDLDLGEMNKILLMKVEELTLYMIELKKENVSLKKVNEEVLGRIERIEKTIAK